MKKRVLVFLMILSGLLCHKMASLTASAMEAEYFIMCQPDSFVNVREGPRKANAVIGYLELGDKVTTDGRRRNGYAHCIDMSNEAGEGWVYYGFLVETRPVIETADAWISSKGRVACRRATNGTRRKWLHNGDKVVIYAWSRDWCITNQGFIQTEFLSREEVASTVTGKQK